MKKFALCLLLVAISVSAFASKLIEFEDYVVYVTSVPAEEMDKGTFKNIKPKGKINGVIMKYTKDLSQCNIKVFGGNSEVNFYDVVKDKNGDLVVIGVADEASIGRGDLKNVKGFGKSDVILVRYNKNLKLKDVQCFGSEADDFSSQITLTKKGDFVISGKSAFKDYTNAFVAKLDSEFKVKKVSEWIGSFSLKDDAEYTYFTKSIECNDGSFAIIGHTRLGDFEKSVLVKTNKELDISDKKSFGKKDSVITLTDIIEIPNKEFYLVGFNYKDDLQKGFLMKLNKSLEEVISVNYMPAFNGNVANSNAIFSIEPLKAIKSYMISGVAIFGGESINYYSVFKPGEKLCEIVPFPERGALRHLVCKDTSFYIIGYDDDKIVPENIGWF